MTDKQIIIDGVDVSGCVHLYREIDCLAHMDYSECCEGYDPSYGYCPKTDCYYKQLKRAEQRIVELNKTIQAKEQECEKAKQIILQAVDDFNLEYGTPQYDRLLSEAKSLGIEVKSYE